MQFYGGLNLLLMLLVLIQVYSGTQGLSLLWFVLLAEVVILGLGNVLALARVKRSYAEIFFVNDHFSLISVHEILFSPKNQAFPLLYSNPVMHTAGDRFTVHFNDQIVTFERKDWDDFDLIWGWFAVPR